MNLFDEKGGEISVKEFLNATVGLAGAALSIWFIYLAICVTISVAQWASAWPF